jgi:hypothetical protein
MASFDLSWTPAGGINSTGQQVQYKEAIASTWVVATSLGASANSYTVSGLLDNVIYDFRIVNLCAFGGPAPGNVFQIIDIICPTVATTPTHNSVAFNFSHPSGTSLTEYRVDLMNAAGTSVLAFKNIVPVSSSVSDSFTGLSATTNYNLRVTCKAETYTKVCPLVAFATGALPACNMPTALVVVIGEES